ncbi:MAG: ATP-binding cassette domain-containing protein [Deltaproteobacteria bacterium]|nr:ATP-binding cassette domain-containing protein [Deltaproteobacteria bacterium]
MKQSSLPFLSLRKASFRLGDRIVFENTSWVFRRNEHWAIIGPNGSGKSLLGEALRGQLPLVQGELSYHFRTPPGLMPEESIGHMSFEDRRLDVQEMVVQSRWNSIEEESALLVRDFLSFEQVMEINPFEVRDPDDLERGRFERRRRRAMRLSRIEPFLDRTLISLSNGERQRVQLARALCRPLRLLMLDEPFVGLDVGTRKYFHKLLNQLMRTPLRVLLITARIEDLPRRVTHLLFLRECQVIAAGPRTKVLALPVVKELLAAGRKTSVSHKPADSGPVAAAGKGLLPRARTQKRQPRNPGGKSSGKPLVQLRKVTVRYEDRVILRDINWTVRAGESWALLGPNGSGKTTLLSLILGDNPQVYGNDMAVFGRQRGSGESVWEIKRRIGWVSPELHLHFDDEATCFEVAASGFYDTIGLFQKPSRQRRAAVLEWLAEFQLLEFVDNPLCALSTGLQRMVLLARALVKRPQLLILDEPCQGLDPAHRDVFLEAVDELIRTGKVTTIYVTHRKEEIPRAVKRVLRLRGGLAQLF